MSIKDAIDAVQASQTISAAQNAISYAANSTEKVAMLPSDFRQHDLEVFMPTRRRARGELKTQDIQSFSDYVLTHSELGSSAFIDPVRMTATAVLNLGTQDKPGHADNKAVFECKSTAAYSELLAIASGQPKTQTQVAEFLEDWAHITKCYHSGEEVAIGQATAAIRSITIEAARKVESEEQQLVHARSALESVQASSKHTLPTHIYFNTVPFAKLAERLFVLRLSIITSDKSPQIILRIANAELHVEEMAKELQSLVESHIDHEKTQVLVGNYTATK